MKKGRSREQIAKEKKENENLVKIKAEIEKIRECVSRHFKSAETISSAHEFKEVSFYVYQSEFDNPKKDIVDNNIKLSFIKSDKDTLTLYYKYSITNN